MQNKIIVFVISLIITITSFMFILYIERKLFNPNGTTKVYIAKLDKIEKGYVVNEKNFDELFKQEERRTEQIVPNYIKNKEDIYNYYVKNDTYKNEILTSDKIESVDSILNKIPDKREVSIKGSDISEVVGGQLREGDIVDVISTSVVGGKTIVETKVRNAYIYKTYTSDGTLINRNNKDKLAFTINFILSSKEAASLTNLKVKLVKVIDPIDVSSSDFDIDDSKSDIDVSKSDIKK